MMASDELTLFGWDLSVFYKRMRLGVDQLLFGNEAGLYEKFKPSATRLSEAEFTQLSQAGDEVLSELIRASGPFYEIEIPQDLSLCREVSVPHEAEAFLMDVVSAEVASLSPFGYEGTCWGYSVTQRHSNLITVKVALAELSVVEDYAQRVANTLSCEADEVELFVSDELDHIRMVQFAGVGRHRAYMSSLQNLVLRAAICLAAITATLFLPAIVAGHSLDKLDALARETEARTQEVVEIRTEFDFNLAALDEASSFFAEQADYGWWLNKIAEIAPDTVYLNRLALRGSELTVTGLALNAAEFQTILVESQLFDGLTATSAFTRDRSGRERFTFVMTLRQGRQS